MIAYAPDVLAAFEGASARFLDPHAASWRTRARPEQLPPAGNWRTWYVRGGRGSGKTWTGANVLGEYAAAAPGEYGVVAPTFADMRDKCVEGPSGLLHAFGTSRVEVARGRSRLVLSWNRSQGELRLRNGATIYGDGADDGAPTIQGFNLSALWADEIGLWQQWRMAWEESIRFAVRVAPARIVATGTPKRGHPLVRALMADPEVHKSLLRTMDNAANLDPAALADLIRLYGGTTLGRQELEGEILEDVPGALWTRAIILHAPPPRIVRNGTIETDLARVVVAVDPATTSGESSDETGIVVAGLGHDARGYVLADLSTRMTPIEWARRAIAAYREHKADRIIAEANQGGDMVSTVIRTVDPTVPVTLVHASRGKRTRAEPVASLYEQGHVTHCAPMPELEDQLCSYTGDPGESSPDRLDALVWGLSSLMLVEVISGSDFSMVA